MKNILVERVKNEEKFCKKQANECVVTNDDENVNRVDSMFDSRNSKQIGRGCC